MHHPALTADNTCHFEDEKICGYTQDLTDNFDWTRQNALTQNPKRSPNTGPPTDISGTPEGEEMACCSEWRDASGRGLALGSPSLRGGTALPQRAPV